MVENRNANVFLIFLNIIIFGLMYLFLPSLVYYLGLSPYWIIVKKSYWQFVSFLFVHGSFSHLLFNMLALFLFGTGIERRVGTNQYLSYYFTVGIISGIFSFAIYYYFGINVLLIGASGAIYGLILYFSVLYPNSIIFIFGLIPVKAPFLVVVYFFIEFFSQFRNDGVSHLTHLFGLIVGLIYLILRYKTSLSKLWKLYK